MLHVFLLISTQVFQVLSYKTPKLANPNGSRLRNGAPGIKYGPFPYGILIGSMGFIYETCVCIDVLS